MKILLAGLLSLCLVKSKSVVAQVSNASEKDNVYRTIVLIGTAWTQNNLDTLDKYIDANYVHSDVLGQKLNRSEWLGYVKDRKAKGLTNPDIKFDDVEISIYGDIAIVTGINTFTGQAYTTNDNPSNTPRRLRFTQILKKENGFWKRLAFQATYIDNSVK